MNEPILCLVIAILLMWVWLLKSELRDYHELKKRLDSTGKGGKGSAGAVKGSRSFKI